MSEKIIVSLREISERFGIGIEGARAKAKRRAAKGTWRILPQNHPADPLRVELSSEEWANGTQQEAAIRPNIYLPTPPPLKHDQRQEAYDIRTLADLLEKMTEQSASAIDRLITAEREKGDAELRAAVAIAEREAVEKNLANTRAELEAIRERLAAADRRHDEMQKSHAAELCASRERVTSDLNQTRSELAAWHARPWWKRLAG